jgi:hypothetical protein
MCPPPPPPPAPPFCQAWSSPPPPPPPPPNKSYQIVVGKEVDVLSEGKKGEVVGTAFGKIRVKFDDGTIKSIEPIKIRKDPLEVRRKEILTKGDESLGTRIKVKVVKNKVAAPFKQCEFDLMFDSGFSVESGIIVEAIKIGLINKAGTWYSYGEERLGQGKTVVVNFLKNNPEIYNTLYKTIIDTISESQNALISVYEESFDAKIISVNERYINTNDSEKNELGYKFKHNNKEMKEGTGLAATFTVEYNSIEIKVVITGDESFRKEIWENKDSYIGKMIEYKGMLIGSKNVPRHPIFERFREDRD